MDSGSYTWNVDQLTLRQMKDSKNDRKFLSPTFDIAGLTWRVEAYPNGYTKKKEGSFDVFVTSIHMPSDWDYIECCIKFECHESLSGYSRYGSYKKSDSYGWPKNTTRVDISLDFIFFSPL